jgi:large repetitive protein
MKQPRYSINMLQRTAARPVAVHLAFLVLISVAGAQSALAFIENTATASGDYLGNTVTSNASAVQVPVVPSAPALEVTKVASPDTNVPAGTSVTYTYTVRNSGNTVLTNISLNDLHNGNGAAPVPGNEVLTTDAGTQNDSSDTAPNDGLWATLAPGDVITMTSTYTITQTDVDQLQ